GYSLSLTLFNGAVYGFNTILKNNMHMEYVESVNPYDGKPMEKYKIFSEDDINQVVVRAGQVLKSWKNKSVEHRSGLLKKLAGILLKNKKSYAQLMSKEMGKPIKQGISEIEKCA